VADGKHAVMVFDMSRTGGPDGERVVGGFPSVEAARAYAQARVRSSLEELRQPGQSASTLRSLWHLYGEDCSVLGDSFKGRDGLDVYIASPAAADEIDWQALAPDRLAEPAPLRRYWLVASLSADELPPESRFVYFREFIRRAARPGRSDLIEIFGARARAEFAAQGYGEVAITEAGIINLFALDDPPMPPADGRPLRNWAVDVDFVCHDIKFGATAHGVFRWPEEPEGVPLSAMQRLLVGEMLALRGDGPEWADACDIPATKISETSAAPTHEAQT